VKLRFDFAGATAGTSWMFTAPREVIEATCLEQVRTALEDVDRARAAGRWVAGFVSYEAAPALDAALTTKAPGPLPLVWFGVFDAPMSAAPLNRVQQPPAATPWTPGTPRGDYDAAVARVRRAILDGDVYQANYTFRLHAGGASDAIDDRYAALQGTQRQPFAACLDLGRWQILSLSPELFFEVAGRSIVTRPMKGTMPRGPHETVDDERREALAASEKDRAENVMIVDLMRNDLGRIAETGSVHVPALFTVEPYPTVFQMTSTVAATLKQDVQLSGIFAALFPAGSVTGAPKAASMRLIAEIEDEPRGLYCGAIGFAGPDHAIFNVAIRTAVADRQTGRVTLGVGGGITWDSTSAAEYDEALAKALSFEPVAPFSLIETMRLADGVFVRLDQHLARLERSARFFGFTFERSTIAAALANCAASHRTGGWRARLLLARDGAASVEAAPLPAAPAATPLVRLARTAVSSGDRWLYHKTTRREIYDVHRASWPDVFDVLLWNERDEITEFTIGNVVVELDDDMVTPPVDAGLLAGIYRQVLLESGRVAERVVTRADLARATRIWLINSLREWVEVSLARES
jgi:para-aminobenzoate synthetase/4-amino-4-deoxychorismate lyase